MDEFITITTHFLSENCEITVTRNKDSVDLDMMSRHAGKEILGAALSPKFAQALGDVLRDAGWETGAKDDD